MAAIEGTAHFAKEKYSGYFSAIKSRSRFSQAPRGHPEGGVKAYVRHHVVELSVEDGIAMIAFDLCRIES